MTKRSDALDTETNVLYTVAVRALCEFTAKQGDLDLRFTPSPTAQEGMVGHASVAARRSEQYQREVRLEGQFGALKVRGRADGYDPERQALEEVKTYRGDLHAMPANHRHLHWAQAKVYAHLLCQLHALPHLRVALVYFNIGTQLETILEEEHSASALHAHFIQLCGRFLAWAQREATHRTARDAALALLAFPHAEFRAGQRQLAEAIYTASARSCCLLAQAPTGIGKTVGTLFPLLKAAATHGLDKIFFLVAKTSGRQLGMHALSALCDQNGAPDDVNAPQALQKWQTAQRVFPLRVLELVAKSTACEFPALACHGDSCTLARGFYDRLPTARQAALAHGFMDKACLREVALTHQVCPYYLGIELARWSDVIVGDYNYYFDLSAMLYQLTMANDWCIGVLVDEAHNMVNRARAMYSAELRPASLLLVRQSAPVTLRAPLERLSRQWQQLSSDATDDYQVCDVIPENFLDALQTTCSEMSAYFAEHPTDALPELLSFYFEALAFNRLADSFGAHSLFDISLTPEGAVLCLRNIIPAPFLKSRFAASRSTTLFSATLSPWNYYADMLGLPEDTAWIDVESPFKATQLAVKVASHVSTRFLDRDASLQPVVELMAQQYQAQPGNYLAFFSSFDYMEQVAALFAERFPQIAQFSQQRRADGQAREQFLACLTPDSCGVGFAVLGGSFGEGIDLPGTRLIGAFIVTLGLPQMNPVNEQIRSRMEHIFGAGYDYAYLYPGLQKVVQAAGRVIRATTDRGVVMLIDDRYQRAEVRQLLPRWWDVVAFDHTRLITPA